MSGSGTTREQSGPKYIAVDSQPVSIIRHCDDRGCDRYHSWVSFGFSDPFSAAREIAQAMNGSLRTVVAPPQDVRKALAEVEALMESHSSAMHDNDVTMFDRKAFLVGLNELRERLGF